MKQFCSVVALLAIALAGCRAKSEPEAAPVVTVDVAPVLLSKIQRTIRAEGLLYPRQQAAIVPKVTGPVKRTAVQRGAGSARDSCCSSSRTPTWRARP